MQLEVGGRKYELISKKIPRSFKVNIFHTNGLNLKYLLLVVINVCPNISSKIPVVS